MGTGCQNETHKPLMKPISIHSFVEDQLSEWSLAADNFKALERVHIREIEVNGLAVKLQFNPARMISSAAKLSKEDIAKRRCFLCEENRPDVQMNVPFDALNGHKYHILVNPYPIFPDHLVVAKSTHRDQAIAGRFEDMLLLARTYPECTFYYNGPRCGASAPDHHHFQGVPRGLMPLENSVDASCAQANNLLFRITSDSDATLYHYDNFSNGIFVIESSSADAAAALFYRLLSCAEIPEGDIEPRINLFCWNADGKYRTIIYFRKCHRSHHYFSDGPDHLTMSPGCADMAGLFIVPVEEEFHKITPRLISEMISEITISEDEQRLIIERLTRTQPTLSVGIMRAEEIEFQTIGGIRKKAVIKDGKIEYDGSLYDELCFEAPVSSGTFAEPAFTLYDVTIGVRFHWERQEDQTFAGDLKIIPDGNCLQAINIVGVEDYLLSVISSEMSSSASEEFLKAHAVISRSWVMARMAAGPQVKRPDGAVNLPELITWLYASQDIAVRTGDEYVKWYDHDDHKLYDVCADDHCQRYQGLTRATGETVKKVIESTWGQVLMHDGHLCDARFSKCCGGTMEKFSTCWQDRDYPYLQALPDTPGHDVNAVPFCKTDDRNILGQVLNSYDQETTDFYQWTEILDPTYVGGLIEKKFGVMTGPIKALEPLERGESGRICLLRIVGELKTITVGKELEIRRILSDSHLKSSAFEVEYINEDGEQTARDGDWTKIRLSGRGWGHGVGLCQIGAAVMASKGYTYTEILNHYYPQADVLNPFISKCS